MENKKIIASFELTLMIVGMFAFSYGVAMTDEVFKELDDRYDEVRTKRLVAIQNMQPQKSAMGVIFDYLRRPMIPVVSAFEDADNNGIDDSLEGISQDGLSIGDRLLGRYFIETETRFNYIISSQAAGVGCCLVTNDGNVCATAEPAQCVDASPFAEGALCAQTSFCKEGCCYDESAGIYDGATLKVDCPAEWVEDTNCNMPAARKGCCVMDAVTFFETHGQCEVRVNSFAQGDGVVDWRGDLNEGQCVALSATQTEGACVLENGECDFGTEATCYSYDGEFSEGFLCTSPLLNTSCEITERTTCVDGKDGVYFLDSCGNVANIYDFVRKDDPVYWDLVAIPEDVCGNNNLGGANANSPSCGNCNRFLGSICRSAAENNFDVNSGEFYCKDTSCMFNGKSYENGESWCVYDGAIGEGDDVVGSRHWKYVCSQGTVQVEPCADYRNQICVQQNTFEVDGNDIEFRNANCIANNWRECINLNSEENGIGECEDTLNCRIEKVDIADKFKFDVCLPRYPGGFSLEDERYMETAEDICGMADQTCMVVYKPKTWGGCELVANGDCLKGGFVEGMNDFCRGLGDCGGSVNIVGEYSENYKVEESPYLSQNAIDELKKSAIPVPGQFAEVEDYTKFLEAAGLLGKPEDAPDGGEAEALFGISPTMLGGGALGVGYAVGVITTGSFTLSAASSGAAMGSGLVGSAGMGAFAGAAIGAGIGMIAGAMLAKSLGLSPGGSMLMAIGGGMVGAAVAFTLMGNPAFWNPMLFWVGVILIIVSLFFAGNECDPVEVTFECKPWKAPSGADDCEKCNDDLLKPCSEYRCSSLGAACELANKGSNQEMCHSGNDDGRAPILRPRDGVISVTEMYGDVTNNGFSVTNINGGCVDAYTPLVFGITTNELAYCKFDISIKEFTEMDYDFGANAYLKNHTTTFTLPDPSHGQSQGFNWTGDLSLYIKCQDTFGHETPEFYTVDMCVNEGDDVGAPIIRATQPVNDGIVGFDVTSTNVTIYVNELNSSCKWDVNDTTYGNMGNLMDCGVNPSNIYSSFTLCSAILPVGSVDNDYYIRCMDQGWLNESERNANTQSFVYTIRKPEAKISIEQITPEMDFEINTAATTIELKIETAGGGDSHFCSFSFSGYDYMLRMLETGDDRIHTQPLNRPAGRNKIYVECSDETGDFAQSLTEFTIVRDTSTPAVARAWQTYGTLHIVTTEAAECKYSVANCNFNWADGVSAGPGEEHTIDAVRGQSYYIKCEDEFGNAPAGCSITLRAL